MWRYNMEEVKELIHPGMILTVQGEEYEVTSLITDPEQIRAGKIANVKAVHGNDTFILKK